MYWKIPKAKEVFRDLKFFILIFYKQAVFIIFISLVAFNLSAQANFRRSFESSDPIHKDSIVSFENKLIIHQAYLDSAFEENDIKKQLYGNLFIYLDYFEKDDFTEASRYLLEARHIAERANRPGWLGWINYRSGILNIRTGNHEKSILTFEEAVPQCKLAGDSLCLGEVYEQLSAMHGVLNRFAKAELYFNKAMPLLKKYGTARNICIALANRGFIMALKGDPKTAISIIKEACECSKEAKEYKAYARGLNNLADAYRRAGEFEESASTYQQAMLFNREHGFTENRVTNLMGLHYLNKDVGDFALASEYLVKRYELRDSIAGIDLQERIAALELKYEKKEGELLLEKTQSKLLATKNRLIILLGISLLLCTIFGFIMWNFYKVRQQTKTKLIQNEESLNQLTQTLIRKNAGIKTLEDDLKKYKSTADSDVISDDEEDNLLNKTILTADDWSTFKVHFEKTHKRYISKLRNSFPELTEAEERLFLLLKLKLTRAEIAAMLGITADTVKKTRSRLRKRLQLELQDSLEDCVI